VPFEVIPFKANTGTARPPALKRHHVRAIPEKARYAMTFPRVEGYRQAIRNRITVAWQDVSPLRLDPASILPEVDMKAGLLSNRGRPSLTGPGKLESINLNPYRAGRRFQELVFELTRDLTRDYLQQPHCAAPAHVLFPQLVRVVEQYLHEKVEAVPPANQLDVFSPHITAG
jgi:type III restriction enzyme